MDKPFQRKGAESNAPVGRDFEAKVQNFFAQQGLLLTPGMALEIGINGRKSHTLTLEMSRRKSSLNVKPTHGLKVGMSQARK
jgi:hypothetical protein